MGRALGSMSDAVGSGLASGLLDIFHIRKATARVC